MNEWKTYRFGVIVTGKGERDGLAQLLGQLNADGRSSFHLIARHQQCDPLTPGSNKHIKIVGRKGGMLADRDQELAIHVRTALTKKENPCDYVVLIDDLEHARLDRVSAVVTRYLKGRELLSEELQCRFAVHFLVNMMEAYFFTAPELVEQVIGVAVQTDEADVENIGHPAGEIARQTRKKYSKGDHGAEILRKLRLAKVLADPNTCGSLRTLIAWCVRAKQQPASDTYQLVKGKFFPPTEFQIEELRSLEVWE